MRTIAIAFGVLLAASTCSADTIVLKDGRQLQGRIVARSRNKIAIKTDAGKLVMFKNDEVAEIVKGDKVPGRESVPEPIATDARETSGQRYYLPVEVRASGMPFVTSYHVDFEELLAAVGDDRPADTNSIRVLKMGDSERGEEVRHRFIAEDRVLAWPVEARTRGGRLNYRVTFSTGSQ